VIREAPRAKITQFGGKTPKQGIKWVILTNIIWRIPFTISGNTETPGHDHGCYSPCYEWWIALDDFSEGIHVTVQRYLAWILKSDRNIRAVG